MWKLLELGEIEKSELKYRRFEIFTERFSLNADPKRMAESYMLHLSEKGYLLQGAYELCASLFGKARLFIITNGIKHIQDGRFARCGIADLFEARFISESVGYEKPRKEFFDYVESHIEGFSRERAIVVGDSLSSDIRGGINAGIDTCFYDPKGTEIPLDMRDKITYTASDYSQIYRIITEESYGDR